MEGLLLMLISGISLAQKEEVYVIKMNDAIALVSGIEGLWRAPGVAKTPLDAEGKFSFMVSSGTPVQIG